MNQSVPNGSISDRDKAARLPSRRHRRPSRRLDRELDRDPEQIEIDEVHDLAVEIVAPVAVDDLRQEQARDHEEVGHAEGPSELDQRVQPAIMAGERLDAQRRMHHHHHDDAEALGVVDPVDPPGGDGVPHEAVVAINRFHPFKRDHRNCRGTETSPSPTRSAKTPSGFGESVNH